MANVDEMQISVLTIFPDSFNAFFATSLIAKARERALISVTVSDIRTFAAPPHFQVDDSPYGGGAGMVMRPEPLTRAIHAARLANPSARVILPSPSGTPFTQRRATELAKCPGLIFVCARYEGVDQRVIDSHIDEEISIGDYIIMGGEVAAMVILEATLRLRQGIVGNEESTQIESFSESTQGLLLEAPHYTRPAQFEGQAVPEVLLSGDHAAIARWRQQASLERTSRVRPDLISKTVK